MLRRAVVDCFKLRLSVPPVSRGIAHVAPAPEEKEEGSRLIGDRPLIRPSG